MVLYQEFLNLVTTTMERNELWQMLHVGLRRQNINIICQYVSVQLIHLTKIMWVLSQFILLMQMSGRKSVHILEVMHQASILTEVTEWNAMKI